MATANGGSILTTSDPERRTCCSAVSSTRPIATEERELETPAATDIPGRTCAKRLADRVVAPARRHRPARDEHLLRLCDRRVHLWHRRPRPGRAPRPSADSTRSAGSCRQHPAAASTQRVASGWSRPIRAACCDPGRGSVPMAISRSRRRGPPFRSLGRSPDSGSAASHRRTAPCAAEPGACGRQPRWVDGASG